MKGQFRRTLQVLIIVLLGTATLSCGAKFSCKNSIDGVNCASVSQVYEHRHDQRKKTDPFSPQGGDNVQRAADGTGQIVQQLAYSEGKPIRVPPKVIRIWIAPWEDSDGDLHQPELIFSEITDKRGRWLYGEREAATGQPVLYPLDKSQSSSEPSVQPKPKQAKPTDGGKSKAPNSN